MNLLDGPIALPLAALAAVLLDRIFGEVKRFHPLVGFGNLASRLEQQLNHRQIADGLAAWALAVLPWVFLAQLLRSWAPFTVDVLLLYFSIGAQSLCEHARAIAKPLQAGNLDEARQRVGWIVSRETSTLDETGVAKAGVEVVVPGVVGKELIVSLTERTVTRGGLLCGGGVSIRLRLLFDDIHNLLRVRAAEHIGQHIAQHHAARYACGRLQRACHKAAAACGSLRGIVLLRWWRILRLSAGLRATILLRARDRVRTA